MKNKLFTYGKKSLAIVMTVMMLMSCWVFMPATHEHLEAEAAALVSATETYNKSLLNGINTNIDTTMPTTMGKFKSDGMNGDENSSWHVSQYGPNHYKNIFYSPTVDINGYAVYMGNDVIPNIDSVRIYYPETVMLYDGSTKPQMGVVTCLDASSGNYIRALSVYLSANQNGLVLTDHWKGHSTGDLAHIVNIENGSYKFSNDGTEHSSYKINTEKTGEWYFYASDIRFDGTLGATEWVRTITPTWGFYGARSYKSWGSWKYDTIQKFTKVATKNIYVMNIKGYRDLISTIATDKTNITNNAGQYTPESIKAYVSAANAVLNLNPKNVSQSPSAVATWGSNMSTAYTNYVNAKNGLKNREYEVTYENFFSLADWKYSTSSEKANVTVDLSAGTIAIKNEASDEYVTNHSGSSGNANTRNTNNYAMPVVGGQEYTFRYATNGADTQMFAFFYDANGGCAHEATFGNYNFTVRNDIGSATFKAPDNATQMEIRFDNNTPGTTATFSGIMIYPAARTAEVEPEKWLSRPYRKLYSYNAAVGNLDVPARDGYDFDKWMADTDSDGVADAVAPTGNITSSVVLYSTWKNASFTLTFDGDGGSVSSSTIGYETNETIKFPTATKENYAFDFWKVTTPAGNWGLNEQYDANSEINGKYGNATLTAQWTKEWTVTYYDGDNSVLAPVKVKDGETVETLPTVVPTKDPDSSYSYEFDHWEANDAEFTADTVITADVNVSPIFIKKAHSNFSYSLQEASTCTENAIVTKKCVDCNYNFGDVTYNPAEDVNAASHTGWLAKGHSYTGGILDGSSTGNTDDDTHSIKCVRYSTCGSVELVKHAWAEKGTDGATCTTPGTVHWSCACGAEKTTPGSIAADEHNYDLTTGTPNGDNATHTVACTYNPAHTKSVNCEDTDKDCMCDICDQELVHVYDKKTTTFVKSKADCLNDAVYYYTCQCGKQGTETWTDVDSKLGHNWIDTENYLKKAADCENDEVYYKECSRCNISSEGETDATWTKANTATGHDYTGTIRDNNNGTHSYLCANGCDTYGYNKVKEASTGCTYGEWSKTEADTHTKTCSECGYSVTEDHSWSKWTTVDGATNTAAAEHTRECTVCGREETTGCDYEVTSSPATCTAPQVYTYTCKDCGHVYTAIGTEATGHKYTGDVHSLGNGKHNYSCANGCGTYGVGANEGESVDCSYSYTNSEDGKHIAKCAACSYAFEEKCSGGTATCTAAAVCEKCNEAYGTTVPHSFKGEAVKLDGDKHAFLCEYCSTEGLYGVGATQGATQDCSGGTATCTTLAVCDVCKDTHGELDADAHDWGKWTNIAGTETHKRVCGYNADHTEEGECFSPDIVVVDPDCETAGYTLNTCDLCGHEWQTNPTDPLGHYWSAWVNNNDGTHTRTCLDETCKYGENGGAKAETASCTKENAEAVVTEPTCTEGGYTTYTCKDCGYEWVDDYVDATGHSYAKKTRKTDAKYLRTSKDCVTDWTYWYCCDECDVSAATEKDKYENEADLYWVREAAAGHSFTAKTATEDYLATEATCTAKATYYYSCSVCGASSKDTADEKTFEYGSVLNHDWQDTETYLKSEADCINNEVYYKECSRCHISSENETGATWEKADTKSGHNFNYEGGYTEGREANCTDEGVVEHYTCKTCGKHFKADKVTEIAADKLVIAALKHDYKDVAAKAATCEEAGYTKHKQCQREGCGYRNTDYKVIAALGHEFKAENGYFCDTVYNYHAYYCSRYDNCGAYGVDNVKYSVDLSGLDPVIVGGIKCEFTGEYVNYEDANGVHSHKLTCVCGNVSSAVCADEAPVHVLPTCTEAGYYIHTCDVCGFVWEVASDAEEDKPLGHDYTNAVWTKVEGKDEHTRKCNRCDVTETEPCYTETPATTCGEKNICDVCKEEFGTQIEHAWTQVKDEKYLLTPAACGVNAVYYKVCANCGECKDATQVWTDEGSALKHVMVEFADEDSLRYKSAGVWKYDNAFGYDLSKWAGKPADFDESTIFAPTCKNDGRAISYCTREGCDHYVTKTASKVDDGHIWGDETTVGGNCATGITIRTECTLCGKTTTRVETVEHTYVLHTYVPATCGEASLEYFVCSVCGDDKEEHKDEALGHDWATDVIEKEATCGQTGRKYSICSRCNAASEKTEIPRLNHVWDMNGDGITDAGFTPDMLNYDDGLYVEASEATCQFEGHAGYYKCYKCSYDQHLDEEWRKNNITEKKDHVDGNDDGKCDECNTKLYGEDGDKNCDCICHKDGWFSKIIYKILRFFWKLFGIGKSCDCGNVHY